jgi:hypothetical protein
MASETAPTVSDLGPAVPPLRRRGFLFHRPRLQSGIAGFLLHAVIVDGIGGVALLAVSAPAYVSAGRALHTRGGRARAPGAAGRAILTCIRAGRATRSARAALCKRERVVSQKYAQDHREYFHVDFPH